MWAWKGRNEWKSTYIMSFFLAPAPNLAPTTPAAGTCSQEQIWKILFWRIWPAHGKSFQMITGDPPTEQMWVLAHSAVRCTGWQAQATLRVCPFSPLKPPLSMWTDGHRSLDTGGKPLIQRTRPKYKVRKKKEKKNKGTCQKETSLDEKSTEESNDKVEAIFHNVYQKIMKM